MKLSTVLILWNVVGNIFIWPKALMASSISTLTFPHEPDNIEFGDHEENSQILISGSVLESPNRRLLIQDPFERSDVCFDGYEEYGRCNRSEFPDCSDRRDEEICYFRVPRDDKFHDGNRKNPYYYIDYRRVRCISRSEENCNRCDPGKFCESLGYCVLQWKRYCPDSPRYRYHTSTNKRNRRKKKRRGGN